MGREPEQPPAPAAAQLLVRSAPVVRRLARPLRAPFVRRLLVVGGFLVCGWLLSGVQSAYAADDSPLPVPVVTGTAATDVVRDTVGKARDAVGDVAAPAKDRAPAPAPARAKPDKVAPPPARTPKKPPATQAVVETVRAAADQVERPTSGETTPKKADPGRAVRDVTDETLDVAGTANRAVSDVGSVVETNDVAGLTDSAGKTISSATTTLTRPLDTLPTTVSTLTAPLGTLTAPLSSLTAQIDGVLGQIDGTAARLVPQVSGVISPITAKSGLLVGVAGVTANVSETLLKPEPGAESPYAFGAPLGASAVAGGTANATVCRVAYTPLLCATPLRLRVPACPLSKAEGAARTGGLCRMPWPSPAPGAGDSSQGMRSSPGTGDSTPDTPLAPRSGDSSHALPTSSHGDGAGDAARSWEARVLDMFVPAWADTPPAVRTAADEPGFSPD